MSTIDLAAARVARLRDATRERAPSRAAAPAARTVAPASSSWFARAVSAWRRHRRIAAGRAALRELDDRMLADLGLDRGSIERAVRRGRL
jgi:uncharacterized protein YjiS (DUF1127 family)